MHVRWELQCRASLLSWVLCHRCGIPQIIRLHEAYLTETEVFLVMELASGGELLDRCVPLVRPQQPGSFMSKTEGPRRVTWWLQVHSE